MALVAKVLMEEAKAKIELNEIKFHKYIHECFSFNDCVGVVKPILFDELGDAEGSAGFRRPGANAEPQTKTSGSSEDKSI